MGQSFGRLAQMSSRKQKKIFKQYDADNSGTVSFEELLVMMEEMKLGKENPADNVQFLTEYLTESMADEDGDGQLDFKEFQVFCKAAKKEQKAEQKALTGMTEKQLRDIFKQHDQDKSGTLSKDELLIMMVELNIGLDDPALNAKYLDDYLHDSGADASGDGRLDFEEFKLFAKHAKVDKSAREADSKKARGAKVVPYGDADRAKKRTAGVGQSSGYSDEAKEFLRKKKEAKAREIAEIAERNRKANAERKKRIADKKAAAGKTARASMTNNEYAEGKAKADAFREEEMARSAADARAHEREVNAKAAALNEARDSTKNRGSVDQSQMNTEYLDGKARASAHREEQMALSEFAAREHEREHRAKANALNAARDSTKAQGTVDASQMNTTYAEEKAKAEDYRAEQAARNAADARAHEREVKAKAESLKTNAVHRDERN